MAEVRAVTEAVEQMSVQQPQPPQEQQQQQGAVQAEVPCPQNGQGNECAVLFICVSFKLLR